MDAAVDDLRVELTALAHAYDDAPGASTERWGSVRLRAIDERSHEHVLVDVQWDLAGLAEWFAESRGALLAEQLVDPEGERLPRPGESLADALVRAQRRTGFADDAADNAWFDHLYAYRTRHLLTFALRGARVAPIVVGWNGDHGDISLAQPNGFQHRFDLPRFVTGLHDRIRAVFEDWAPTDAFARVRRAQILDRL